MFFNSVRVVSSATPGLVSGKCKRLVRRPAATTSVSGTAELAISSVADVDIWAEELVISVMLAASPAASPSVCREPPVAALCCNAPAVSVMSTTGPVTITFPGRVTAEVSFGLAVCSEVSGHLVN